MTYLRSCAAERRQRERTWAAMQWWLVGSDAALCVQQSANFLAVCRMFRACARVAPAGDGVGVGRRGHVPKGTLWGGRVCEREERQGRHAGHGTCVVKR